MAFITDPAWAARKIQEWIHATLELTGRTELILGLSGGIDSALACYLAVEAVGAKHVHCMLMPSATSSKASLSDAKKVLKATGADSTLVEIAPMVAAFEQKIPDMDKVRKGNLCARLRMIILFDRSHASGLVLGTSNKTESLLGYGTLYGDAAWSLNPLADLYKTDVRLLSKYMGVPEEIQTKAPTADLWEHQTDEGELGFSYADMDNVLVKLVDEKKTRVQIVAEGYSPELVDRMLSLIRKFAYKRKPPYMCWLREPYSTEHLGDPHW